MRWSTIARYGGVGDSIVASSVFPGLKKRYDGVEVICQAPHHVVYENNPFIDKLSVYQKDQIPGNGWQEWHALRAKENGPDGLFVNLSHSMETTLAFVPAQCQFQWSDAARRKLAGNSYLEMAHDIVGIPYDEIAPNFFPTEEETAFASGIRKKLGEKVIAWVLTGTRIDKIYPYTPMAIARLIYELGADVIMIGHPEKDKELADVVNSHVLRQNGSTKGLHFARAADPLKPAWPLRDVLTMVQHCDLVIGPDTGPMWAVAMRDMPKILTVSHASDENITKHWVHTVTLHADQGRVPCWPCHKLHDVKETCVENADKNGAACISDISVEAIMQTAIRCLAGTAHYRPMTTDQALTWQPKKTPPVEKPPMHIVPTVWVGQNEEEEDDEDEIALNERTHYAG